MVYTPCEMSILAGFARECRVESGDIVSYDKRFVGAALRRPLKGSYACNASTGGRRNGAPMDYIHHYLNLHSPLSTLHSLHQIPVCRANTLSGHSDLWCPENGESARQQMTAGSTRQHTVRALESMVPGQWSVRAAANVSAHCAPNPRLSNNADSGPRIYGAAGWFRCMCCKK